MIDSHCFRAEAAQRYIERVFRRLRKKMRQMEAGSP
jgi:hypothetical protein